ncbi:MAG: enoyl-CoA hydratase-related protein, partial [Desulfurococcales archaeon]|nr:enoyl-CoA hydratase-related protein [Desulfurococcales archaeon]
VIGAKRAAYLALTGELITAEEALEWGIINGVVESVEELESRVRGIASRIASNDPWAVGLTRRLLASARGRAGIGEGLLALAYSASRPEAWGRARGFIEGRR